MNIRILYCLRDEFELTPVFNRRVDQLIHKKLNTEEQQIISEEILKFEMSENNIVNKSPDERGFMCIVFD